MKLWEFIIGFTSFKIKTTLGESNKDFLKKEKIQFAPDLLIIKANLSQFDL